MKRMFSFRRMSAGIMTACMSFSIATPAFAANLHWIGGSSGAAGKDSWTATANWSSLPRGTTCSCTPTSNDIVIFSYSGGTVRLKSSVVVKGIHISNAFTGTVLIGTGTLAVGGSGIRVGSGRLIGGTNAITNTGSYTQTGGIVSIQGNYTQSGTTFSITDGSAAGVPSLTATGTIILDGTTQTYSPNSFGLVSRLRISSTTRTDLGSNAIAIRSLQIDTGSTLRLSTYTMSATSATILNFGALTEQTGKVHHTGSIVITDSSYAEDSSITASETIYFSLNDSDENIDGTSLDTVNITATGSSGDTESVTLTETSVSSGIFRGSLLSRHNNVIVAGNSSLETIADASMTATNTDAQDGLINQDTASFPIPVTTTTTTTTTSTGGGGGGGGRRSSGAAHPVTTSVKKPVIVNNKEPSKVRALDRRQKRLELIKALQDFVNARAAKRKK